MVDFGYSILLLVLELIFEVLYLLLVLIDISLESRFPLHEIFIKLLTMARLILNLELVRPTLVLKLLIIELQYLQLGHVLIELLAQLLVLSSESGLIFRLLLIRLLDFLQQCLLDLLVLLYLHILQVDVLS